MAELERTEGIPIDQQRFIHKRKQLQMGRTLRGRFYASQLNLFDLRLASTEYSVQKEDTIHLVLLLKLSGGGAPDHDAIMGFAAGGRISQKIIRDPLPVTAYDHTRAKRLHVTVINAAYFQAITGLPSPPSPIRSKTYIEHKLPWYELYEEHLPTAPFSSSSPLADVKSVAQLLRDGAKH